MKVQFAHLNATSLVIDRRKKKFVEDIQLLARYRRDFIFHCDLCPSSAEWHGSNDTGRTEEMYTDAISMFDRSNNRVLLPLWSGGFTNEDLLTTESESMAVLQVDDVDKSDGDESSKIVTFPVLQTQNAKVTCNNGVNVLNFLWPYEPNSLCFFLDFGRCTEFSTQCFPNFVWSKRGPGRNVLMPHRD